RDRADVRVERVGLRCIRPREHVFQQVETFRVDAEVEHVPLEEPPVGERAPVLLPEPRPPERLAADVLEATPPAVADVPRPRRPAERPAVLDKRLHAPQIVDAGVVARYDGQEPARYT